MAQPLTPVTSPLVDAFVGEILPSLGKSPPFDVVVHRLSRSKEVYLMVERHSGVQVVAKLFGGGHARETRDREFRNMQEMERLGLCEGPFRAVRAHLSLDEPVAILMERAKGRDLDHYIKWAVRGGREEKLRKKLYLLARWFALLHSRGAQDGLASGKRGFKYLVKVVSRLGEAGIISPGESQRMREWGERWLEVIHGNDHQVWVHGDATPTNLFLRGELVTAIDFERAKVTHRCWDLGFLGGELAHHFMWRGGDQEKGREFFHGFIQEYAAAASVSHKMLGDHLPLYLAMGLLRIARNPWLDLAHRRWLVDRAMGVLSS